MPEGDTLWRAARTLDASLSGRALTAADLRVPVYSTADLKGRRVESVAARGKHILMHLNDDLVLHTTLGMDGSWRVFRTGQRWSGGPWHQIRAVLTTADVAAVGYRLPHVNLWSPAQTTAALDYLGPDLLGPDWDPQEATDRLLRNPTIELGVALLDQRNLAGIGNVFKSEISFLTRNNPWTRLRNIPNIAEVVGTSQDLLFSNRNRSRRLTTPDPGDPLWVYRRTTRPCRRCGGPIRCAMQGASPAQRSTWWCPACQPFVGDGS